VTLSNTTLADLSDKARRSGRCCLVGYVVGLLRTTTEMKTSLLDTVSVFLVARKGITLSPLVPAEEPSGELIFVP
jgi:hypothetical protein